MTPETRINVYYNLEPLIINPDYYLKDSFELSSESSVAAKAKESHILEFLKNVDDGVSGGGVSGSSNVEGTLPTNKLRKLLIFVYLYIYPYFLYY